MISEIIEEWIKGILIDGITGNLSGLFDNVNAKVGEIAADVGATPQAWNSGIFNMLQNLSETVVLPIAAAILACVRCMELIQMITEKNNMHDFDSSMFFRWIFKSAFAILIVSNTWNIVMGIFDATQSVVNQSAGVIIGETSVDFDSLIPDLESQLEAMSVGGLLGLWFQSLVVGLTMNILAICIFLVTYGRMIEIYVVTSLGPILLATMGNSEWRGMGQNYLKSLLAPMEDGQKGSTASVCTCTTKCKAWAVNTNCPICKNNMSECTGPEPQETQHQETEAPQEEPKNSGSGAGGLIVFLVVALAGGGAALYYFKLKKPRADTKGSDDLDEYDFGDDENLEDEEPETEFEPEDKTHTKS